MVDEYEVEAILQARVEKRNKRGIWKYHVKWQGYSHEENTWEPAESFAGGSQHLIEEFWKSVDTGGRNRNNISLFPKGEILTPSQLPKKQLESTQQSTTGPPLSPSLEAESSLRMPGSSRRTKGALKKRSSTDVSCPPIKRPRVQPSNTDKRTSSRLSKAASTLPPRSQEKSPLTIEKVPFPFPSSPNARPSKTVDSESEIRRDYHAEASGSKTSEQVSSKSASLDRHRANASPAIDHAPYDLFGDPQDTPPADYSTIEPTVASQQPYSSLPSHRARVTNPLIKWADTPNLSDLNGAIAVKTNILRRHTIAPHQVTSPILPNADEPSSTPVAVGDSNPGPSRGLPLRKSSLLTFTKGSLKTLKRHVPPTLLSSASQTTLDNIDTSAWSEGIELHENINGSSIHVPTGKELLEMAGYDAEDATNLSDFEDDPPDIDVSVATQNPGALQLEEGFDVDKLELAATNHHLLPATPPSASNIVGAVWKRSTIFGPLSVGLGASEFPSKTSTSSTPPNRSAFVLSLDYSVTVPVMLKDISPCYSGSHPFDTIVSSIPAGPPGKFYKDGSALAVLSSISGGGSAARVSLCSDANEIQQQNFDKLSSKLRAGELFIAMSGPSVLAFFSSENSLVSQRLNVPRNLSGISRSILVSHVIIENHSAYADTAIHAETTVWL